MCPSLEFRFVTPQVAREKNRIVRLPFFTITYRICFFLAMSALLDFNTDFVTMLFSLLSLISLDMYFFRRTAYVSVVIIRVHHFCVSYLSPRHLHS